MKKRKTLKMSLLKDLTLTFLIPFLLVLLGIFCYIYTSVKEETQKKNTIYAAQLSSQMQTELEKYVSIVETAAMQEAVIYLDYTQAEPYLQKLLEKEGTDVWSHFLIANQYGTEQAHTEGKAGRGFAVVASEIRILAEKCRITAERIQNISKVVNQAIKGLSQDAENLLQYIDSSVLEDYSFFYGIAENYSRDAVEISKMMTRFAEHAEQLRVSFTDMDSSISHITDTMDDNSSGIEEIVDSAADYSYALHEINEQISSCDRISLRMKEILEQFREG